MRTNRFQENGIRKPYFWDPKGTNDMRPMPAIRLFKSPALIRAQYAIYRSARRLQTPSTQPLPFRNVRDTITILVNR